MGLNGDKIGFIINVINTGWEQNIWNAYARTARAENKNLYIFPGGQLGSPGDTGYLRNPIYSLINSDNLDGLISFSSSIRYGLSDEEFQRFHSGFEPLPYITIDYKVPGHINVNLDSYKGMKELITHCIKVHGAKKIAFLRGPDYNTSAQDRYRAYEDALREAGLPFSPDSPLVTKPFEWGNGQAAAAQLLEERKLIPGIDFDTLIGPDDLMILLAINYFEKHFYYMPADYHAIGFDNSAESQLTECPLSTVQFPYSGLSSESLRVLDLLINKNRRGEAAKEEIIEDILLPMEVVIRESCGCSNAHYLPDEPLLPEDHNQSLSKQEKIKALTQIFIDFFKPNAQETRSISLLVRAWFRLLPKTSVSPAAGMKDTPRTDKVQDISLPFLNTFFDLLKKILNEYFITYRDTESLLKFVDDLPNSGLVSLGLFRKLEPAILRHILKAREKLGVYTQYERDNLNSELNSLKCDLLGSRDRDTMLQSLARYLSNIGIYTAGLALYVDNNTSLWIGSFSPEGISDVKEQSFPSKLLVPESLEPCFSRGIFMVQPLFTEDQSLGYFIHTISKLTNDGIIYEDIRSVVSYALKGIATFEEVQRAKQKIQESDEQSRVLTLQKEAALAASEAKSQFLASISHEIRTPMNAVLGMSELLLSENLNKRQRRYVDDIKTSAMALLEVINDILDLSKLQAGGMNLVLVHYDFKALIHNINSMMHFLIKGKNITFKINMQGDIPRYLYGDDVRLRQILLNILSNAVKFTNTGYVQFSLDVTDTNLVFTIKDTGRGIRKEDLPYLFEAFKQFDAVKNRDIKGTGLGLSITKALVEMMNGLIEVESVYGQGSAFHITIPKILGDETKIHKIESSEKIICSPDTKILVVDDNVINLNVISGLLKLYNILPSTAISGQQAIEMIRHNRYDLVFMDHMMPEMDGVEAAKLIRNMDIKIPIIALTANVVTSAKEMLLAAGMDDFLAKPIMKEELNQILIKWIPSSQITIQPAEPNIHTHSGSKKNAKLWDKLNEIDKLSVKIGLERVSGQKDVYESALKLLIREIDKCIENLHKFLAADDMHNFAIEAHSIKSSLANLGAMDLSVKAHELEMSSENNETTYCAFALRPFLDSLANLRDKLKEVFSPVHQNKAPIVNSELLSILERMKESIKKNEYVEINNEIQDLEFLNPDDGLKQKIEEIKDAIMIMDYTSALELIQKLQH